MAALEYLIVVIIQMSFHGPRDKMLKERPGDIVQEKWLENVAVVRAEGQTARR